MGMMPRVKQHIALKTSNLLSTNARNIYYAFRLIRSKLSYLRSRLQHSRSLPRPSNPDHIIWISEYYTSRNPLRQEEINHSLLTNLRQPWISRKVIAMDSEIQFKVDYVFQQIDLPRLKFSDFLKVVDQHSNTDHKVALILTNSDISLTDRVAKLLPWMHKYDAICLSRHEAGRHGFEYPPEWYQDCWILQGQKISQELISMASFALGIPGCDNHFAALLHDAGFTIWNPCINTEVYHHHLSSVRTHTSAQRIKGAYYEPYACTLEEFIMRQHPGGRVRTAEETGL